MLVLAIALLSISSASAQDAAAVSGNASPQVAASPTVSPTPVPFAELVTQAEITSATLKEILSRAGVDATTQVVEQRLPVLTNEINARLDETAKAIAGQTSLERLRDYSSDLNPIIADLTDWNSDLARRVKEFGNDLQQLSELETKWQETLIQARQTETAPEVVARIQELINSIAEARKTVESQRSQVVALQNRVAEQQNRIAEAVASLRQARNVLVGRLFVRESPPIWSRQLWAQGGVFEKFVGALAAQLSILRSFADQNTDKLVIHFLTFALFTGVLYFLRGRAKPHAEADPQLKHASVIFYLPVSTALVLAIMLSGQIYPQTPKMLGATFGAVALVPTVIILHKLIDRSLYPVLYLLVIFYFIDQVRSLAEGVPLIARPLFLAEMLGGFLFFVWLYRTRLSGPPPEGTKRSRLFRTMKWASLTVLPFFLVSFVANALGYSNLASLVGNAVLRSSYAAVILYGAVRIIDGLIVFALRFRPLSLLNMVQEYRQAIQERFRTIIRWIAFVIWLLITLELFTLRETVWAEIRGIFTAELTVGSLNISLADVLLFALIVWVAFKLSKLIRFILDEDVYPRLSLAPGIPYAVSTVLNYAILLIGFFFAVGAAGFDLTRFTVLVGAFGVGIGFGLQNIINNFVSGLILLFERPIKVGDEIAIQEASGTVRRIGIRASIIKQWDNSEIIVPNSKLISENVKNWTRTMRKRGIEIPVKVAHGADANFVTDILNRIAAENPLVADKPAPQVLMEDFGAYSLNFKLRAWTTHYDKTGTIASEMAFAINKEFAKNGVEAPPVPVNPNPVA